MRRREFLTASLAAGGAAVLPAFAQSKDRVYYEMIRYRAVNRSKMGRLQKYWEKAAIPALNRLGITPIGVFQSKYGTHGLDFYVLIPHPNLESFVTSWEKITADPVYLEMGKEFISTAMDDPLYNRFETSLLHAFSHMPRPEVPAAIKGKESRIFELRTYESHNRAKAGLKIEMFNEGKEIALFRETGLHPVFFAQTLAGANMPNLVYMLGFENLTERDKNWEIFVKSEEWQKMSSNPRYADTVSSVTDYILRPAAFSQI